MAILQSELKVFLSGGAANSDPNASIGGAKSSTEVTDASLHNLFDLVSGTEASSGDTEYRCVYLENTNGSLTWSSAKVWISTTTPSTDSSIEIAIDTVAGIDGTAESVANESTAPSGLSFSSPTTEGGALTLPGDGNLDAGEHIAIWVKRIIGSGAAAYSGDNAILTFSGDTPA